jgi:hypothetical protein
VEVDARGKLAELRIGEIDGVVGAVRQSDAEEPVRGGGRGDVGTAMVSDKDHKVMAAWPHGNLA